MMNRRAAAITAGFIVCFSSIGTPQPTCDWQRLGPVPTDVDLRDVTWGNNQYVAIGEHGTIITSSDATRWNVVETATAARLNATEWTGHEFVIVGDDGLILASEDANEWHEVASGVDHDLLDVAVGPDRLLAVGANGLILTSSDGDSWSEIESGVAVDLNAVIRAETTWIAVGDEATVLMSENGETWVASEVSDLAEDINAIAFRDGILVVVGRRRWIGAIDGDLRENWRQSGPLNALASCSDFLVGVGFGRQLRLIDDRFMGGEQWKFQDLNLNGVTCDPTGAVAVGRGGQIVRTSDGAQWRNVNAVTSLPIADMAAGPESIVATAGPGHGGSILLTSSDGVDWQITEFAPGRSIFGVAYGNDRFVAVGGESFGMWVPIGSPGSATWIWTSADGISWEAKSFTGSILDSVIWTGDRFIAMGRYWGLAVSENGDEWRWLDGPDWHFRGNLASDGEITIVMVESGPFRSRDLEIWTAIDLDRDFQPFRSIAYGGGHWVMVGEGGQVLSSADGLIWTAHESGTSRNLQTVRWIGDSFVTVGADSTVLSSDDGEQWFDCSTNFASDLYSVASFDSSVIIGGRDGSLARSISNEQEAPPIAAFSWLPKPVTTGVPVHFRDLSVNNPSSRLWTFSDGTSGTDSDVSTVFDTAGQQMVHLTVANQYGSDTESAVVAVLDDPCPAPPAPIIQAPESVASHDYFEVAWTATPSSRYEIQRAWDPSFTGPVLEVATNATHVTYRERWFVSAERYFRVRAIAGCSAGEAVGPWSATAVVHIEPDMGDLPNVIAHLPVAANTSGLHDTRWKTDLALHNPYDETVPALLYLLDDGDRCGELHEVRLAPGSSQRLPDLAALLCDSDDIAGGVVLASTRALHATSRTYNATEDGGFGARMPLCAEDAGMEVSEHRSLIQLTRSEAYRTNLGATNFGDEPAMLGFDIRNSHGQPLANFELEVGAGAHEQIHDVFSELDLGEQPDAWAGVSLVSGPGESVHVYASVVDNRTGDGTIQLAEGSPSPCRLGFSSLPSIEEHDYYRDLAFGHGRYVATGDGLIASSADLDEWRVDGFPEDDNNIRAVEFNGSEFVAVGHRSYVSGDGLTWSEGPAFDHLMVDLAWGDGVWVAVGVDGFVATSADGQTWAEQQIIDDRLWYVEWAGTRFVANGQHHLAVSDDGASWEVHPDVTEQVGNMAWGNGIMVAVKNHTFVWSLDGLEWQPATSAPERFFGKNVLWAGDRFLAISDYGAVVVHSFDGKNWFENYCDDYRRGTGVNAIWDGTQALILGWSWLARIGFMTNAATLPGAAHLDGANGSRWRTDLELVNHSEDSETTVLLTFRENGEDAVDPPSFSVDLPPGNAKRLTDVVASVFGSNSSGAISVSPADGALRVSARTYDDQPEGTVGQHIPTFYDVNALRCFDDARIPGLATSPNLDDGFRTNIGFVSICAEPMIVELALYDGTGDEPVRTFSIDLDPFEPTQLDRVFGGHTDHPIDSGFAILRTGHPRCGYHAYASVIDNRSGDPVLIPAEPRHEWWD